MDYHQGFLPQELLWRHRNSKEGPDMKPSYKVTRIRPFSTFKDLSQNQEEAVWFPGEGVQKKEAFLLKEI